MYFKNDSNSVIEPIRLETVRFFPVLAVATLSSPISKDHRFSLILTHGLKTEVMVKELESVWMIYYLGKSRVYSGSVLRLVFRLKFFELLRV